jgi:hypothetical protein
MLEEFDGEPLVALVQRQRTSPPRYGPGDRPTLAL